ncbi:hypothetical protein DPMN_146229 [Dreissena polymorpha]|uniref:Uncharacterized protein n=1 Tax=Dreissena polymorpha TaxID=45954 RepID=A0A9D4F5I6_DREPO|nr:hypothetical protein DPMN_146229 [Dreissena polymorpha]
MAAMFFNKPQAINTTNLRTKFHEDWAINVTSRVLTSKTASPRGGLIFQQTKTIFKLSLAIMKTKVQTRFHEYWTVNETPRVLTRFTYSHIGKTALPPGGHVFLPIRTIFKLNRRIQETNVLTTFHEDWTKSVTSRAFTYFHYIHIEKTAPPLAAMFFHRSGPFSNSSEISIKPKNTALPPVSNVTSTVLTRFFFFLTYFELGIGIIGTDVLTKFHEDRTINVASMVFTRQMLTTDARRTTNKRRSQ